MYTLSRNIITVSISKLSKNVPNISVQSSAALRSCQGQLALHAGPGSVALACFEAACIAVVVGGVGDGR